MRLWGVLLLGVCASLPAGCTRSKEVRDGPEPGPPPLSSVEQYNYKVHHARTGDTLAAIGRTYGVPWRSIALVNDIPPPYRLAVGQVVLVPLHLRTTQGAAAPPRVRNETPSPPPQRPTSPQTVSVPRSALHRGKPNHAFWWPTSGTLARRYGDVTRGFDEPGIGIRAPAGTEVYAVAWGRVICTVRSDAGVRWITPYVCAMTVNGDPTRRTGFWDFYDHWGDYESLGLSARPKADPFEWLQLTRNGTPRIYYGYKYPDEFYPPFADNHRFAACWRTTGWQTWLSDVIRFVASCDFDGAFVDNGTSQRCECPRCLAAFRRFVGERYSAADSERLFGHAPERVEFPSADQVLLLSELKRFWCLTLSRQMAALKRTGSAALGREFIIFPNGGRPSYIQRGLADTDFVMFENVGGEQELFR